MIGWLRRVFGRSDRSATVDAHLTDADADDEAADVDDEPYEPPPAQLTEELDLHTFQPKECADVVDEYVRAAREAGFASVRVIHGKGKGVLRRIVHSVLEKHPDVASFALADPRSGSWGATLVQLKPRD